MQPLSFRRQVEEPLPPVLFAAAACYQSLPFKGVQSKTEGTSGHGHPLAQLFDAQPKSGLADEQKGKKLDRVKAVFQRWGPGVRQNGL